MNNCKCFFRWREKTFEKIVLSLFPSCRPFDNTSNGTINFPRHLDRKNDCLIRTRTEKDRRSLAGLLAFVNGQTTKNDRLTVTSQGSKKISFEALSRMNGHIETRLAYLRQLRVFTLSNALDLFIGFTSMQKSIRDWCSHPLLN